MFVEIGLHHRLGAQAQRKRWFTSRAMVVAGLAAVLLVFTGVIASVVGFRTSDSALVHALITAPFPLAMLAAALSFRFRRELSAIRQQQSAVMRGDVAGRESSSPNAAKLSPAAAWKRICCPIDFSEGSRFAMEEAAHLAWRFGADLTLVNVRDRARPWRAAEALAQTTSQDRAPDAAQRRMSEWAEAADAIAPQPVAFSLLTGDPIQEIVRFAEEGRFDVLVMGASGRLGRGQGPIASRVVLEAPCSVVVARPSREPSAERRDPGHFLPVRDAANSSCQ